VHERVAAVDETLASRLVTELALDPLDVPFDVFQSAAVAGRPEPATAVMLVGCQRLEYVAP
jgi:hypothetical protein